MKYLVQISFGALILAALWLINFNFKKHGGYCFPESRYLAETDYQKSIEQAWDKEILRRKKLDPEFTRLTLSLLNHETTYNFDRGAFDRPSFSKVEDNLETTVRIHWGNPQKSISRAFISPCGRVLGFDPF